MPIATAVAITRIDQRATAQRRALLTRPQFVELLLQLDKKSLGLLINFNVSTLKRGITRVACGDLFKDEAGGRGFAFRVFSLLCASVPLWFK